MQLEIINKKYKGYHKNCPVCDAIGTKYNLNWVASIAQAPLKLGIAGPNDCRDEFINYNILQCNDCELIMLDSVLPDSAYDAVHSEAVGRTWKYHHVSFAEFIGDQSFKKVLEIGPSNNPMARKVESSKITYIDQCPIETLHNENYIQGCFPQNAPQVYSAGADKFDLVIASHVWEHTEYPQEFFFQAWQLLKDDGVFCFSLPDFERWINNGYWNAITPEHTWYPTIKHLNEIFRRRNVHCEYASYNGHSIFGKVYKNRPYEPRNYFDITDKTDLSALAWCEGFLFDIENIENELDKYDDRATHIFGGSHLAQYPLLMSSKINSKVLRVLDNSESKRWKRLYGTRKICNTFEELTYGAKNAVIIGENPYKREVIEKINKIDPDAIIIGRFYK
jgi:SAM-dependent methyltransferase